jgi:outer membrane protein assembly factor BamB
VRRRTALGTIGSIALAGCLSFEPEDTPEAGGANDTGAQTTSSASDTPTATDSPTPTETERPVPNSVSLRSAWQRTFASEYDLHVDGGVLYTPFRGGAGEPEGIRAVAAGSGETRWTADLGTSPSILYATTAGNRLYLTADERLFAVDTETGSVAATMELGDTRGAPAVVGDTLVVGTTFEDENTLYGLDPATLEERWRVGHRLELDNGRYAPSGFDGAVSAAGLAVSAYRNGRLSAYDPATGDERWVTEFVTAGPEYGPYVDGAGGVVAVDSERRVVASLDPETGETVWEFTFQTRTGELPPVARPTFVDGIGFLGVERHLFAFDVETGERRWHVSLEEQVTDGRLGVTNDTVWAVTGEGTLQGYDRDGGDRQYRDPDPPLAGDLVGDGSALLVSSRSSLGRFEVSEEDGS